jgi:hypothetical protein
VNSTILNLHPTQCARGRKIDMQLDLTTIPAFIAVFVLLWFLLRPRRPKPKINWVQWFSTWVYNFVGPDPWVRLYQGDSFWWKLKTQTRQTMSNTTWLSSTPWLDPRLKITIGLQGPSYRRADIWKCCKKSGTRACMGKGGEGGRVNHTLPKPEVYILYRHVLVIDTFVSRKSW